MSDQANLLRLLEPSVRPSGSPAPNVQPRQPLDRSAFSDLLQQARANPTHEPLKLSAHAQQRLEQRGISLSDQQMNALAQAADRAGAKGANDALMLMDDVGMIVNVPNRTVLTVLDEARMNDGVVTQIDSAVIVRGSEEKTATDHATGPGGSSHRLQL
ncbi:MAG: TIGR02530 family flagellar biosynthesis protein [Phycisphaeraceae bacterium]